MSASKMSLAAEVYAKRYGIAVLPVRPREKSPLSVHGCRDATLDEGQIRRWWEQNPYANVGGATGQVSNLLVLDVDGPEGQETLSALEREHGEVFTPRSLTGGGMQLFFRSPGYPVKNRVKFAPGLDVRADGGYVVLPPSIHPNGKPYTWEVSARIDEMPLTPAPEWLLGLIVAEFRGSKAAPASYWRDMISSGVSEGCRNQTLAKIAGHLLRRFVDPYVVLELLKTWNNGRVRPPLEETEIEKIVDSIAAAELRRRGAP